VKYNLCRAKKTEAKGKEFRKPNQVQVEKSNFASETHGRKSPNLMPISL
jgi:hypothetical protein